MSNIGRELRQAARKLGLGAALLKVTSALQISPVDRAKVWKTRSSILPRIAGGKPIPVGGADIEIHMLLNHQRLHEGMWAIYSLCHFAGSPLAVTIHDDGTMTGQDAETLTALFPGIRIIYRRESDQLVNDWLHKRGLGRCRVFRDGLVFGVKLFDPHIFRRAQHYILLDSDVLFFRRPDELLDTSSGDSCFSVDFGYEGSFSHVTAQKITGSVITKPLNAGLLRMHALSIDCARIESHLADQAIWRGPQTPHWFAEQALYAAELHLGGAKPLSDRYRLAQKSFNADGADAVHFCGGGIKSLRLYTHGIPHLASEIQLIGR